MTSWGAVISAIAAAIGLIFSGVASWVSVKALGEQRAEANQEDQLRAREQASKVSVWMVKKWPNDAEVMMVANYSIYPLETWGLYFRIDTYSGQEVAVFSAPPKLMGVLETIPPCTRASINLTKLRKEANIDTEYRIDDGYDIRWEGIIFGDVRGEEWRRHLTTDFSKGGLHRGWAGTIKYGSSAPASIEHEQLQGCSA